MRWCILLCLSLMVLLPVSSLTAQECSADALSNTLDELAVDLKEAPYPISVLNDVESTLDYYEQGCGLHAPVSPPEQPFDDSRTPILSVSGEAQTEVTQIPVEIEELGVYRIRLVSEGFLRMEFGFTSACYKSPTPFLFVLEGEAVYGIEFLYTANNCRDQLEVSYASAPWVMDFYPMPLLPVSDVDGEYSSDVLGQAPVIGPVRFADGQHKVTLRTESQLFVGFQKISGDCEIWHTRRNGSTAFFYEPGPVVQTILTSKDCVGFITFGPGHFPWTLTFEPLE